LADSSKIIKIAHFVLNEIVRNITYMNLSVG